jgi:hypothetical protein
MMSLLAESPGDLVLEVLNGGPIGFDAGLPLRDASPADAADEVAKPRSVLTLRCQYALSPCEDAPLC